MTHVVFVGFKVRKGEVKSDILDDDVIRPVAADLLRAIPNFRGKGRVASLLNRQLLRRGADPIVECRMARGHRLRLDLRVSTQMHTYFSGHYNDEMLFCTCCLFAARRFRSGRGGEYWDVR